MLSIIDIIIILDLGKSSVLYRILKLWKTVILVLVKRLLAYLPLNLYTLLHFASKLFFSFWHFAPILGLLILLNIVINLFYWICQLY